MKFTVSFKCPDALIEAIEEAVKSGLSDTDHDDAERKALEPLRIMKLYKECSEQWFKFGEYCDVEVDTDAGTCTVLEAWD